ncbi:hypothetical protein MMC10_005615 [Thelotrema lepadinum]|nr:hypothetical protein [Thelotrema lepadinum]
MLSSPIILFAALASIAAALPALESRATSYQIRSVSDPIYHLYLQSLPSSRVDVVSASDVCGDVKHDGVGLGRRYDYYYDGE